MSDEVFRSSTIVLQFDDPVQRSPPARACTCSAFDTLVGSFITRVGTRIATRGQ